MNFPRTSAQLNAACIPAITQTATRTIESLASRCANGFRASLAQTESWLQDHNELHARYKEKWLTWEECCQEVYGCSRQAMWKKSQQPQNKLSVTLVDDPETSPQNPPKSLGHNNRSSTKVDGKVTDSLSESESKSPRATPSKRESNGTVTADQWEKKEQYSVKPPPTPRAAPTENGKPKKSLAIWREIEETLFGRALNRLDELNRLCPNSSAHSKLIAQVKSCMAILDSWKQSA